MSLLLFWLMIGGFVVTTLAAIATWVLKEIAWHELEEYCKPEKTSRDFRTYF